MGAQAGNAILLAYGGQGVQQSGAAVLLSFDVPPSGARRVASSMLAPWMPASWEAGELRSTHAAVKVEDHSRRARWIGADSVDEEDGSGWGVAKPTDDARVLSWWDFGAALSGNRASLWSKAVFADEGNDSRWSAFGPMLNEDHGARWVGSKPADVLRLEPWRGFLIPTYGIVPYVRPAGNVGNFSVAGGFLLECQLPEGDYLAPALDAVSFIFAAAAYTPTYLGAHTRSQAFPAGDAVDFSLARRFELVLDGLGQPLLTPSHRDREFDASFPKAVVSDKGWVVPWLRFSHPINPGWGVVIEPGAPTTDEHGTIIVPILRTYIVSNSQSLTLASTGQVIPASGISLGIDADSWVWGWQASVPGGYLSVLQADPGDLVEVIANINGNLFRLAVEHIQRDRRFAKSTLAISGKGRAAWLAAPYAPVANRTNVSAMSAQQLMASALMDNGVPIGWDLDWRITDWTVPAGVWSHSGSSMEACLTIAEAAGAYIQAAPYEQVLQVLPRYPAAPWHWNDLTPDFDLPEDVCVTEGIQWMDKPAYNTVFVAGQADGVLGHVTRAGTDGGLAAPMVTDPLMTHADAVRQRGTRILSDTGRQAHITLSMPVLEETGIIPPGQLIRYHEGGKTHLGLSRSVAVSAQFPKIRQNIVLETHVLQSV